MDDAVKVDVFDPLAVKNALDNKVLEYYTDHTDCTINMEWDNLKLILKLLAIVTGSCVLVGAKVYHMDAIFVYIGVGLFFTFTWALEGFTYFIQKNVCVVMEEDAGFVHVCTAFKKYESKFVVSKYHRDAPSKVTTKRIYIGDLFDEDGYVFTPALHDALKQLMR